jgi:hypothetical protein
MCVVMVRSHVPTHRSTYARLHTHAHICVRVYVCTYVRAGQRTSAPLSDVLLTCHRTSLAHSLSPIPQSMVLLKRISRRRCCASNTPQWTICSLSPHSKGGMDTGLYSRPACALTRAKTITSCQKHCTSTHTHTHTHLLTHSHTFTHSLIHTHTHTHTHSHTLSLIHSRTVTLTHVRYPLERHACGLPLYVHYLRFSAFY